MVLSFYVVLTCKVWSTYTAVMQRPIRVKNKSLPSYPIYIIRSDIVVKYRRSLKPLSQLPEVSKWYPDGYNGILKR